MNVKSTILETNSWGEFQNKLSDLNKKQKGDAFELLTKLFFKVNPIYAFYDEIWMLSEVPQTDLEYLELPSHDLGIDLIAKNGNEYHAIQCKYHSNKNQSVTFKEVSTFISLLESNKRISQGYICSSAFVTSRNYNKLKTKPINLLMSDTWQQLDSDFFTQAHKLIEGKKTQLEPFKPRIHQQKALKKALNHFRTNDEARGKLIFPCGAGKSLTGFWITQKLESKSTIIAVPSLSLVKQTLEVYLREIVANGDRVKWLCICSDKGIGKNDDVVYHTENLGVPCQTDPVYIEDWLKQNRDEDKIIFTTYQSGRIIANISKKLNFKFDVGIFDEAHKTVGSAKKLFSHLLFDKNISISKRIFMTATERFYSGSKDDIISMDNEDIYGDTFAKMSFKEAIEQGLLTDYKVVTIDVRKSEIADFIRNNNLVQLNDKWEKETEARSLASMLALRKAMRQFNIKNAVSFHSSIEKAVRNKELQEYITESYNYLPIDTYTVSGKIPTTKRNDIVQEFAQSPNALITNARCLTEGVDVPNIDCIVFADPRKSKVDIVQALGRALRKNEGKDWGYVILPVVYDDETQEIDNDNFNEILAIVRGLASNDERIVEYFKDKNKVTPRGSNERIEQFNFEIYSDYIDEKVLAKQLDIKLWEKLSRFNWMSYEESREYVRKLNLNTQTEWIEYCKSGDKPFDIPRTPDSVYKDVGWKNLGDWLGSGFVATQNREYLPFEEAREFVHKLGLKLSKEWFEYSDSGNKPDNIPRNCNYVYKNSGWLSFGDWLGTKIGFKGEYKSFTEAKLFVQSLNLNGQKEWLDYCKSSAKPFDIPTTPEKVYRNDGWKSFGDWLGTGIIATRDREYLSFKEAKLFVQTLNLNGQKEWLEYCKSGDKPIDIPRTPEKAYKNDGWKSLGDWLGTGFVATNNREYLPFVEVREFVHKLELKNVKEWESYRKSGKKPDNIPSTPQTFYRNKGWKSWGDFLATGNKSNQNREYLTFEDAKNFVHKLKLNDQIEWQEYCKSSNKPLDIPSKPARVYNNKGWNGLRDWLGTIYESPKSDKFLPFEEARNYIQKLGLKNNSEWREYCKSGKKPKDIPDNPDSIYKEMGWLGYGDWLATENEDLINR